MSGIGEIRLSAIGLAIQDNKIEDEDKLRDGRTDRWMDGRTDIKFILSQKERAFYFRQQVSLFKELFCHIVSKTRKEGIH